MRLLWTRLLLCSSIPLMATACERPRRGAVINLPATGTQQVMEQHRQECHVLQRVTFTWCDGPTIEVKPPESLGGEQW